MLNKNSLLTGFFFALIFPAIAWAASYYFKTDVFIINRPALPFLIAIALNLIAIRFALKRELDKTGKGIMAATFMIMLAVFIFKAHIR